MKNAWDNATKLTYVLIDVLRDLPATDHLENDIGTRVSILQRLSYVYCIHCGWERNGKICHCENDE